jgi:hypothetical protein
MVSKLLRKLKKFLESNENGNRTCHNLWNTAKAVLRGKFIAMSAYTKKSETSQFKKIHKIDKPLAKLTKGKRKKTQINKIRDKKEEIATNTTR